MRRGWRANTDQKGEVSMGNRLYKIVDFEDLKWTPLIKGCDLASLEGDPNAAGAPFVLRLRCADGAKIPAHWHPTDENATVLKGTLLVGMGETFDEAKLQAMNVSNFVSVPKEMRHFAMSKGETIVQVHGMGPSRRTG
jgi:anti-sigma factor ChrR (cupin superfamily)